jgi:hypothetical protein
MMQNDRISGGIAPSLILMQSILLDVLLRVTSYTQSGSSEGLQYQS